MIQPGSTVKIVYTLMVDGQMVSYSTQDNPLSYVQGQGEVILGLEEELQGLRPGDKTTVKVSPERGFGVYNPNAIREFPKTAFKNPERLNEGDLISTETSDGSSLARVAEVRPNAILLDLNHPLAGKTLDFEVEVIEVK